MIRKFPNYILIVLLSLILFSSAYALCSNFFVNPVYDFLVKLTAPEKASEEIVVVAIDDASINRIGRWPWRRTVYTDIFEFLENKANAKVIAFDSVLTSYGYKEDDDTFFNRFSRLKKVIPGMFFSREEGHFSGKKGGDEEKFSVKVRDLRSEKTKETSKYMDASFSLKEIMAFSEKMGSVLSSPDSDGVIRRVEHVFYYKDKYYPSLALAVFQVLYPDTVFELNETNLKGISDEKQFSIPIITGKKGSFSYLKWYKTPYKTISAWKIIENHVNPEFFKDKIVVLGATSTAIKDIKTTPMGFDYPGVYIQATAIDNLINSNFMRKLSWIQECLILFLSILIGVLAIIFLPPLYSSISLTFLAVGYFYACLFWMYPNGFALDAVTPIVFLACTMLIGYGYEYFLEYTQKNKTRTLMEKYVSKEIMTEILKDTENVDFKGKREDISILFADIRNFTHISETIPPEEVTKLLNEYFNELIPVIFKHKGTVNKFIGDAVMVIFGAPIADANHAENAVKCALDMINTVNSLSLQWLLTENKPSINIGIGISSGEAFVGNVGAVERFEYTAIGNTVNVANRLESFNKLYKTSILISEDTYERVKDRVKVKEIDSVSVTQDSEPLKIYELKALKNG